MTTSAGATVLTVAVAVGVYANALTAPFLYDDIPYVVQNEIVREPGTAVRAFWVSYPPQEPELGLYRPITSLSYALDAWLVGLDPVGFHATNAVLHALASLLVFALLRKTGAALPETMLGTLLFAVHPVHTEAVAWVVGRAELLAAAFGLASVLLYARHRRTSGRSSLFGSVVCYLAALGSKETAAVVPAALLAGEALGLFDATNGRGMSMRRVGTVVLGYGAAFAAYCAVRIAVLGSFGVAPEADVFALEPTGTRLRTAIGGVFEYLRLGILPTDLRIDYSHLRNPGSAAWWRFVAGFATLASLTILAYRLRRRAPRLTWAVIWFGLFLLPVSNLAIPIGSVLAERFLYLPSVAFSLAAAEGLRLARARGSPAVTTTVVAAAALVLIAYGAATVTRNRVWADSERFWLTAIEQNPADLKASLELHALWLREGEPEKAERVLRAAASRRLATVTTSLSGEDIELVRRLADTERARGRCDRALFLYERILSMYGKFERLPSKSRLVGEAHLLRGVCLVELGRPDEARTAFESAVRSGNAEARRWLTASGPTATPGPRPEGR
jgi:hypothetical protein